MELLAPGIGLWRNTFELPDGFAEQFWMERYKDERGEEWVDDRVGTRRRYENQSRGPIRVRNYPLGGLGDSEIDKVQLMLNDVMLECLTEYMKEYPSIYDDVQWQEAWRLIYYYPGARMGVHSDNTPGRIFRVREGDMKRSHLDDVAPSRVLCGIQYLTDFVAGDDPESEQFVGGEISWPYVNVNDFAPSKGDLLIYPANFLYSHKVNPILAGYRIANLTCFCQGVAPGHSFIEGMKQPMDLAPGSNMYLDLDDKNNIKWIEVTDV